MARCCALCSDAVAAIGPLTLLVNNAGMFEPDDIGHLDRALFDRHFAVNLRAPLFLSEAFAAHEPHGRHRCLDRQYSRSAGLQANTKFHQLLADEVCAAYRNDDARTGACARSARQRCCAGADLAFAASGRRGVRRPRPRRLPLRRGPSPQDVADAVVYLAGARGVSGVTIAVDGGQHLAWQTPDTIDIEE